MIQAMFSGISGMKAFKSSLDVIGNNIANVNTTAYKSGRATFKDMMSQTMRSASAPSESLGGSNPSQVGLGTIVGSIDTDQTQGSMTSTGRGTDVAIEGNGMFALGNGSRIFFTRDGSFSLDAEHKLTGPNGLKLIGWTADSTTGEVDTSAPLDATSSIEIPIGGLSIARGTTDIKIAGNLDASADIGDSYPIKFSIYDSLGLTHDVSVTFTKAANQTTGDHEATWDYTISCPDAATQPTPGQITFDTLGYSKLPEIPISLTFTSANGSVQPLNATINTEKISQLNGQNTVDLSYQNGLPLGTLESFSIDRSGGIIGTFTNGSTRALGQLALGEFNNPAGLSRAGNNLLVESPNSGSPRLGMPGSGGLGLVSSGFLEASNVDLAAEFASMIVAQRGFQANSRIITTSDEVLQELVQLKR